MLGPPTIEFGGPWGPPRSSSGAHGAPHGRVRGPMGPLTVVFPAGKKFSPALPAKFFFRFTVEFITIYFHFISIYFHFLAKKGPNF